MKERFRFHLFIKLILYVCLYVVCTFISDVHGCTSRAMRGRVHPRGLPRPGDVDAYVAPKPRRAWNCTGQQSINLILLPRTDHHVSHSRSWSALREGLPSRSDTPLVTASGSRIRQANCTSSHDLRDPDCKRELYPIIP